MNLPPRITEQKVQRGRLNLRDSGRGHLLSSCCHRRQDREDQPGQGKDFRSWLTAEWAQASRETGRRGSAPTQGNWLGPHLDPFPAPSPGSSQEPRQEQGGEDPDRGRGQRGSRVLREQALGTALGTPGPSPISCPPLNHIRDVPLPQTMSPGTRMWTWWGGHHTAPHTGLQVECREQVSLTRSCDNRP